MTPASETIANLNSIYDNSSSDEYSISSTINLIDNAYQQVEKKKFKDILISNIEDDIEKIVMSLLSTKAQTVTQTDVLTREKITRLEKEVEFLRKEME